MGQEFKKRHTADRFPGLGQQKQVRREQVANTNTHICIIGTAPWTPSIEGCVSLYIHLRAAPNPGDQAGSPEGRPVAGTSMGTTVVEPPAGRARPLRHPPHESRFRPMPSETEPPAGWMVVTGTGGPLGPREKLKKEKKGIPLPLFMKKTLWRKNCKIGFTTDTR